MIKNTPIRQYKVKDRVVFVKREDLCTQPPCPPFAKVRGLYPILKKCRENGTEAAGYMETTVSMAGWGISYFCKQLGMKAVIFKPVYKDGILRHEQEFQESKWKEFGADVIPIQATRLQINWHIARNRLIKMYPNSMMLPQGLPFEETVREVCQQILNDRKKIAKTKAIVSCIGGGTMAAGIVRGCASLGLNLKYYGVVVAQKNLAKMNQKIHAMAGVENTGLLSTKVNTKLIDAGYIYTQKEECGCPFSCNPYYDRKAWKWLTDNIDNLEQPILFWNIGA